MTSQSLFLPVKGMTCAACSIRLERVLGKVAGVEQALVSCWRKYSIPHPG